MAEHLVKLWIRSEHDPAGIDWQAWLPKGVEVERAEVTRLPHGDAGQSLDAPVALPNTEHPSALQLRGVADLIDRIYVSAYDEETGRWGNAALAELDLQEAAGRIALWLVEGRTPVAVPVRKERP